MLKLYYAPVACSISPHVALREAGLPFALERVDFMAGKKIPDGRPLTSINPKGYVPALELDDGQILTEGVAIVQYVADLKPEAGLAPAPGTFERVRLQEWLNFVATELHKGLSPLFSDKAGDEYKKFTRERVGARLEFLAKSLEGKKYVMGDRFTVVDGYVLYALRTWKRFGGELSGTLAAYYERLNERPAVKAALEAEGLKP